MGLGSKPRKTDCRSRALNQPATLPLGHRADSREGLRVLILHTPFAKTRVPRHSSLAHTMHTASFSYPKAGWNATSIFPFLFLPILKALR